MAIVATLGTAGCAGGGSGSDEPSAPPAQAPIVQPAVPANYQAAYSALAEAIERFDARLNRESNGTRHPVVHGANLFLANCHRGEELLAPQAIGGVALVLDQFQRLGIQGVTIALNYPLVMPDFPSAGTSRAGEYWSFYERVAAEVRARGMKLNIESGVMFGSGGFTPLPVASYYAAVRGRVDPLQAYTQGRIYVLSEIARRLRPDSLAFGAEPDVAASLVGLPQIADPAFNQSFATQVVQALKPISPATSLATGVGTWLPNAAELVERYGSVAQLDHIDLHIYPVHSGMLDRASDLARQAHALGKRVFVSEAWLYKEHRAQLGSGDVWAEVLSRNVYDFWEPLDVRFHEVLIKWVMSSASTTWRHSPRSTTLRTSPPIQPRSA